MAACGVGDRVVHRYPADLPTAFARARPGDDPRAALGHPLGPERALAAGEALHDDLVLRGDQHQPAAFPGAGAPASAPASTAARTASSIRS